MDSAIFYPSIGIIILILIIVITINSSSNKKVQTKEQKRAEILQNYKEELQTELSNIEDDDVRKAKKTELLKRFSDELSRNIFFDAGEIRDIILELSRI